MNDELTNSVVLDVDADVAAGLSPDSRLVLARAAKGARPNVAWLTWIPASTNSVSWAEQYGIFVASVVNVVGRPLRIVAATEAVSDRTLTVYSEAGFASSELLTHVPRRRYDVRNDAPFPLMFGLSAKALVNGETVESPLNAVVVPPGLTVDFSAPDVLYAWFSRWTESGTIIDGVPHDAASIGNSLGGAISRCAFGRLPSARKLRTDTLGWRLVRVRNGAREK